MRVGSVTVIGSATIDRIEQSRSTTVKMGGVVVYSGITFRNHGLITGAVTNVAAQDQWLLNILRQHQVEVFNGVTPATTMFVNHVEGDDRWQEMPISAAPITVRQVERALKGGHHVHLGPLHPADIEPGVLRLLRRSSATVSLDVQGYVRHVENSRVSCKVSDHLAEALSCSTLVKAASRELEAILGYYGMSIEEVISIYDLREAIVTAGRRGGYVATASNVVSYQAKAVEHEVDPTGAGDVFFASYLVSRIHARQSIEEACEHAASLAARQVEGRYIPGALLTAPERT